MAKLNPDETMVDARIVYWGAQGAGKTANLQSIHRKLRPDSRGEIERVATRIDPTVEFEQLPIELGEVGGLRTRIQTIAVPGGIDQAPTRKHLLDEVDGVVLVVDSRQECLEANVASLDELRAYLEEYGYSLEEVPLVVQYNKRDLTDPYSLDELHRKLDVRGAAVFEAVATEATGVLQTLATLAKHVIRRLRGQQFATRSEAQQEPEPIEETTEAPSAPEPLEAIESVDPIDAIQEIEEFQINERETPANQAIVSAAEQATVLAAEPATASAAEQATASAVEPAAQEIQSIDSDGQQTAAERIEDTILSETEHPEMITIDELAREAQTVFETPWDEVPEDAVQSAPELLDSEFSIASVGEATRSGERGVRIPLVVAGKDNQQSTLILTVQLEPLLAKEGSD